MFTRSERRWLWFLAGTALLAAICWIQSIVLPLGHTSFAAARASRILSASGRVLWQAGSISPDAAVAPGVSPKVPAAWHVGSNENGPITVLHCGSAAVPFIFPSASEWFGYAYNVTAESNSKSPSGSWMFHAYEFTISYLGVIVVCAVLTAICLLDAAWRKCFPKREKNSPATA